jgi:hypothetical protein
MGQHDAVGVPLRAQCRQYVESLVLRGRSGHVQAEPVIAHDGPRIHEGAEVVKVVGVPTVRHDDLAEVGTLLGQDLQQSRGLRSAGWVCAVMGAPVSADARPAARRMRTLFGVNPSVSVATLMDCARMPESPMPTVRSRRNILVRMSSATDFGGRILM